MAKNPSVGDRRLRKFWSDGKAEYVYSLEQYRVNYYTGSYYWSLLSQGDLYWAQRTAEHYGLTVPTEEEK